MKKVEAAGVQFAPVTGAKMRNAKVMCDWIRKVKKEHDGIDLILFPELATNGYDASFEQFKAMAERPESGQAAAMLKAAARECNVYVGYGYAEDDGEVMYNSLLLIDRNGEVCANYRKVHPFANEKKWCGGGEEYVVADTDFGKVGLMICYDASFPEVASTLARMGAELLAISTNWEDPHLYDWDLITSARAFDNTLHVVSANRVGGDYINTFSGHSRILNPMGRPISEIIEPVEGYCYGELDLEETMRLREGYYQQFKNREPSTYLR